MSELHDGGNYPGRINVVALGAHPKAIASAFVHTDDAEKHAVIELGFHRRSTKGQRAEARRESMTAVIQFLGGDWSAEVRAAR